MKKLSLILLLISLKSQAQKKGIKFYVATESFWAPGTADTTYEAYVTFVKDGRHTRAFSVTVHNDTAYIMPTVIDSVFIRAKVIKVAGKTFVRP